jgi:hypothetical protein
MLLLLSKPDKLYLLHNNYNRRRQKGIMDNREEWRADLLWNSDKGRICDYCGINMDIPWLDILMFFHEDCWKKYRKDDNKYPMPKYA